VTPSRARYSIIACLALATLLVTVDKSHAQIGDLTIFAGTAYPIYDERLTLRPSTPSLPGAVISVTGSPAITADGGLVVGAALAFEAGLIGIEGRLDSTAVGFDLTGGRYEIRPDSGPITVPLGSVTIGDGRLDANRLQLLSLNLRLRTPGPVSLVASGGFSLLPNIEITGSAPLSAEIIGLPLVPQVRPTVRLVAAPGESNHRYGVNGGLGLRVGGSRVAAIGEVRAFYFREYELRFDVDDAPDLVVDLLEGLDPIRFTPIIINAQVGLVLRF
jgi:hypothetical protein